jgi:hypothetical protein
MVVCDATGNTKTVSQRQSWLNSGVLVDDGISTYLNPKSIEAREFVRGGKVGSVTKNLQHAIVQGQYGAGVGAG